MGKTVNRDNYNLFGIKGVMVGATGLEPVTSCV